MSAWAFNGATFPNVVRQYFSGSNIAVRDKNNCVTLERDKVRVSVAKIYLNAVAATSLGLGCFMSMFAESSDTIPAWLSAFFVIYMTMFLSWLCWIGIDLYVRYKYPMDIIVAYDKLKEYDVDTISTEDEIDDILK